MTEGETDSDGICYNLIQCNYLNIGVEGWSGFKIVGDNLDKNFRRSYQRLERQTVSHHYFHMYAVKDRVDLCQASDLR
jgi:L1 cell adhesion molecule like protein